MSYNPNYDYLPWLVPTVTAEYLLVIAAIAYWSRRRVTTFAELTSHGLIVDSDSCFDLEFFTPTFENTSFGTPPPPLDNSEENYDDKAIRNRRRQHWSNKLLLSTRLASLFFFLSVSCIWMYIRSEGHSYYFFTTWNVELLCVYFLLASYSSLRGICYDPFSLNDEGIFHRHLPKKEFYLQNIK